MNFQFYFMFIHQKRPVFVTNQRKFTILQYLHNKIPETCEIEIKKLKQSFWKDLVKGLEIDMQEGQKRLWGMLRRNKLDINDTVQTSKITIEEWKESFEYLYREENSEDITTQTTDDGNKIDDQQEALKKFCSRTERVPDPKRKPTKYSNVEDQSFRKKQKSYLKVSLNKGRKD